MASLPRVPSRFLLTVLLIPALLTLQCGSDSGDQASVPCRLVAVPGCNVQILAAGTYTFTVTSVGTTCFVPFQAFIAAFFNGTTIDLPSFQALPATVTLSLPAGAGDVTATISASGNLLQLTNITPNPIVQAGATVTIHCVYLCPASATQVNVALDLTVNVPGVLSNCRDNVQVTGVL